MKIKIVFVVLLATLLLCGCGYSESDLQSAYERGFEEAKIEFEDDYSKGYEEGQNEAYSEGYEEGYWAGRESIIDDFGGIVKVKCPFCGHEIYVDWMDEAAYKTD